MKKFIILSLAVGLGIAHTGLNANFFGDMQRFHRETQDLRDLGFGAAKLGASAIEHTPEALDKVAKGAQLLDESSQKLYSQTRIRHP